jgi:hypothetical protein
MRSGQLHQFLHAFASEAAQALTVATTRGEEVSFEVVEERARAHQPALYCYRPLTGPFVERHWHELRVQPSAASALAELACMPGLTSYLELHGIAVEDDASGDLADTALRCFTARVFDGCDKSFLLVPERFEPAYRELFENAFERRTEIALLGLLRGASATAKEIALGEGMLLAPLERLGRVPPDPNWVRDTRPSLVVAIDPGDEPEGIERALACMLELQTAMRLYAGGISFAPLAWIHTDGAHWRALPLGAGGRTDGKVAIVDEQHDALRAFCASVARRRPSGGPFAWALRRFELGCERENRLDGLSDHLMALRALLEPEGPTAGRLAARVAALRTDGEDRNDLAKRVLRAQSLEQAVISGGVLGGGAIALAAEIEERLRSLLRDVIAGQLRGDLAAAADARIYEPEIAAGVEADAEFQVTRTPPGSLAAALFATPEGPAHRPSAFERSGFGERQTWSDDDSVFELPTTELRPSTRG